MTIDQVKALIALAVDKDRGKPRTHDDARDAAEDREAFAKLKGEALAFLDALENKLKLYERRDKIARVFVGDIQKALNEREIRVDNASALDRLLFK